MTQPDLFSARVALPSRAVPVEARPRLSRQNAAILARLQQGPASNHELAQIALKYTSRLSEIKKAGYAVRIVSRDHETGRVVYALGA